MKTFALAVTAVAALSGQALAADMSVKAVRPAPVAAAISWTGCYVAGGGGYGLWDQENTGYFDAPVAFAGVRTRITETFDNGGKGWFGTVQGGCDYQFALGGTWQVVVGVFGDYDFADIRGQRSDVFAGAALGIGPGVGTEKLSSQYAVGGRIGVLVTPQLLTYVSAGYTEARYDRTDFTQLFAPNFGVPTGIYIDGQTYKGYFLGSGIEYALNFLPGLFWKTEYRFSETDVEYNQRRFVATAARVPGDSYDSKKYIQTVRSELVYRFNFGGGAVVAKY
jgi:outer membrane immunogenic protein